MTIAIISDIHGNYEALSAVIKRIDDLGINQIYCLGDVVGYYTQINECCDLLRKRQIPCLMGNHDWYLAGGGECPRSKSVNDCLRYQRNIITPVNKEWLQSAAIHFNISGIKMVHGGWADPIDEYLAPEENYFQTIEGKLFSSGHTHIQSLHHFGDKSYCNPGSVGQPRDNDPRAAFATFDTHFTLHRVTYDTSKVFSLMEEAGFNDYYYGCLETGARNLCKLSKNQDH
jgi:putative phosphoesterase